MKKKLARPTIILFGFILSSITLYSLASFPFQSRSVLADPAVDSYLYLPTIIKPVSTVIQPPAGLIYIDHNAVALFDQIPAQYIQGAADINMVFIDRSVGGNIDDGLNCLTTPSAQAPSRCTRNDHPVAAFQVNPSELTWTGSYDNSNWDFLFWPGAGQGAPEVSCSASTSSWPGKIECFLQYAQNQVNNYDILTFQYSYLSVDESSTIADSTNGFFVDSPSSYDVYDIETFEAQHPTKVVIYWTTSLSRGIGSEVATSFNDQMRLYAINNDKVLFDVADILSHDPNGNPCYDNRDGVPYDNGNTSENHPDDGKDLLAICPHYTTEVDGGHLGSVSAGKIRVAKAYWVLMARLAGWDGN